MLIKYYIVYILHNIHLTIKNLNNCLLDNTKFDWQYQSIENIFTHWSKFLTYLHLCIWIKCKLTKLHRLPVHKGINYLHSFVGTPIRKFAPYMYVCMYEAATIHLNEQFFDVRKLWMQFNVSFQIVVKWKFVSCLTFK